MIENKDIMGWRAVLIEHGGKNWETNNVQLWKDNKFCRDVVSVHHLKRVNRISELNETNFLINSKNGYS